MLDVDDPTASLGNRLKLKRKELGYTLARVSDLTGISISMLSKIENGKSSLGFNKVVLISESLGVAVSSFLGEEQATHSGRRAVTRRGEGPKQSTPHLEFEVLCDDLAHKKNVHFRARVLSRSIDDYSEMSSHPGEEFILVISGSLELHTDLYKPILLKKGDSICFDAQMGHAYVAISEEPPELMMSNSLSPLPIRGYSDP